MAAPRAGSLRRPSLVDQVREFIKSYTQEKELKPGDQLPSEVELSRLLGVSRSAVREAVTSLRSMGIVQVQHGNGLFLGRFSFEPLVASLPFGLMHDDRPLSELLEIRRVLEVALIPRVIESQTDAHMAAVDESLAAMHDAAEAGDSLAPADREFHQRMFAVTGNKMLLDLLDVFWFAFDQARRYTQLESTTPLATYQAHALIAEAVRAQDVKAAQEAMDQHYVDLVQRLSGSSNPLGA